MGNIEIQGIELQEPLKPTAEEQSTLNTLFSYKAALKDSAFYITTPSPAVGNIIIIMIKKMIRFGVVLINIFFFNINRGSKIL